MRRVLYGLVTSGLFLGGMRRGRSEVLYWGEATQVQRANLDGSGQSILVGDLNGVIAIALDLAGGQMYWANFSRGDIWRANLDGSGATPLIDGQQGPLSIALDVAGGQMYWANRSGGDI